MHAPDVTAAERTGAIVAIGVPCGAGAWDPGCREGPIAFRRQWELGAPATDVELVWRGLPQQLCCDRAASLQSVAGTVRWLAGTTRRLAEDGSRFLVIGGDHSCAIGTWSGVAGALRRRGRVGLIWIDAHTDMHVPETTHSGAINGMPVAALLGHGAPQLTGLAGDGAAIDPGHICLIGSRSFEPEEIVFARRHGVRIIDMAECKRRGIGDVLAEAHAIATNGTVGYGVSLDLDAFDPMDAPGVGTPVADGIRVREFADAWIAVTRNRACRGIEIVEYNPFRDDDGRTAQLMTGLVAAAVSNEKKPWAV